MLIVAIEFRAWRIIQVRTYIQFLCLIRNYCKNAILGPLARIKTVAPQFRCSALTYQLSYLVQLPRVSNSIFSHESSFILSIQLQPSEVYKKSCTCFSYMYLQKTLREKVT